MLKIRLCSQHVRPSFSIWKSGLLFYEAACSRLRKGNLSPDEFSKAFYYVKQVHVAQAEMNGRGARISTVLAGVALVSVIGYFLWSYYIGEKSGKDAKSELVDAE